MAVISIRKFLAQSAEDEQALRRVVHRLLEGIEKHAAAGDSEECSRFRETIRRFATALDESEPHSELLVQAGALINGFEEYNHFAAKQQRLRTVELQHMVKMLTATVRAITASRSAHTSALADIEQRITAASQLDDVRVMKATLAECLTGIRKESELQQKEAAETIDRLNQGIHAAQEHIGAVRGGETPDTVTGLPGRQAAEAALVKVDQPAYAAVMVLDRLQALNARFGRAVGDDVLAAFTEFVRKNLRPEDRLFRWGGPTLLVLLPRPENIECVRNEVARMMATRMEHTIQTPSRSLLVPVSARWTVLPVMAATRLMCQRIDIFAAPPGLRE